MKPPSLTAGDREQAWSLLLTAWHDAGAGNRHARLSEKGFLLCQRRFGTGDRDPRLLAVLGREALAAKRWDREAREVLVLLGALDLPESEAARRAAVRCDAALREYSPARETWYRQALAAGSVSAATLLTVAALRGRMEPEAATALAVRRATTELTDAQWQAIGLDKTAARRWLALWYSRPEATDVPADAVSLVREQVRLDPTNTQMLAYLARVFRPRADAAAVEVYEALFRVAPDNADNTSHLAESLTAGTVTLRDPVPVLEQWLRNSPENADRAKIALATNAAATGRDDDQALAWLEAALALPAAPANLRAWLAVLRARRGRRDEASLALYESVLADETPPAAWRGEVGLALLASDRERGEFRAAIAERTWHCLPADRRPDELALKLAEGYVAEGRCDAAVASIYRRAHDLNPYPDLSRLLSRAYLVDESTPVRTKIAHWRACLELRRAEPEIVEALAKAYASLGSATEAAIYVAESAPPAQRVKLLDDLCRYRFRRGDFSAAEALASAMLRLVPDDDSATRAEAGAKLLACKVRRRLADGRSLGLIDTTQVAELADHNKVGDLLALLAAAHDGSGSDAEVAAAIARQVGEQPALAVAAQVLSGQPSQPEAVDTSRAGEVWLLALAAHCDGQLEVAERLLGRLPEALALAGRALFGALPGESEEQAIERLLPVIHRHGPPWDSLRAVALDLLIRFAPADLLDQVSNLLDDMPALAAELRVIAELAEQDPHLATQRVAQAETATDPDAVYLLRDGLWARHIYRLIDADDYAAAERELTEFGKLAADPDRQDQQARLADAGNWLRALLARRRGQTDLAWDRLARLSPEARAVPAVAWTAASWHLADDEPARAEAELGYALAERRNDADLLYAVLSLNASLGRTEKFSLLVDPVLAALPADDPRRPDVDLLRRLMVPDQAEVDLDDLFVDCARLSARDVRVRLLAAMVVAAAQIRARRPAEAAALLKKRLAALNGVKLPTELAETLAEVRNLRGYAYLLAGDAAEAERQLARLPQDDLAAGHNRARVAVEAGDTERAAELWERLTPLFEQLPFDEVAKGYREAARFAWHLNLAELYLQREAWRPGLDHLEVCLKVRPYDMAVQRRCIPALIALGEGEVALYKSDWLIGQRPHDLELLIEHGMVLASVRGSRAGLDYFDDLSRRRPDAVDVVRQKKIEMRDRILESCAQRAKSRDFVGLFTLAREVEVLVENDEERAKAILQQAFALSNMGEQDPSSRGAVLEQAFGRIEEALALSPSERVKSQLVALRGAIAPALAPELARNAGELLRHRRREYMTITENLGAPSPGARGQVQGLAEAFERIVAMADRAVELGGAAQGAATAELRAEASKLARECRRLEATWQ
ncbi:MAG: hypothetical protein HZB16_00585 [Armatimonadetes bacterium]|nr:hypothetical protein [Armatimonadota bacterium]